MFESIQFSGFVNSIWLGVLAFCLFGISIVLSTDVVITDESIRKNKFRKISKKNAAKERLDDMINENMDYKKRKNLEKLILQSGHRFSTVDFYLISVGSAMLLSLLLYYTLNNIFVGIVMLVIGFLLPKVVLQNQRTKRMGKLNSQVGTFINVVIGRYEMLNDFSESLRMSIDECYNQEPIATEIQKTIMDLDLGLSVNEAMENLTLRTGNKHIEKLTNNYKIATNIGTKEARKKLLGRVIDEYNTETVTQVQLKKELRGPVMEAYLMCGMVPGVMLMQVFMTDGYVEFMTQETLGQIGMGIILTVIILGVWFINAKVAAPLE